MEASLSPHLARGDQLASLLEEAGWSVVVEPEGPLDCRPDLVASRDAHRYAVELKSVAEGRADRVIALLSQAILQASRYAADMRMRPLAVVLVGRVSPALRQKVVDFQRLYAPDVAVGLVSEAGGSLFIGPGLEGLDREEPRGRGIGKPVQPRKAFNLFSDLNQWMLKVLLAPELPERLLHAPRSEYFSGSDLAHAADVSPMSASRFLRRLQEEGFLDGARGPLRLVRREELFRRWQSAAMRSSPELRMSYLIPAGGTRQLHKLAARLEACVGLFAAADLLELGHVSGAVPHVYVRRLSPPQGGEWLGVVPSAPGEAPQVIIRQANAPESLFRGAVRVGEVLVSDVLQVWLDVSANPSRGAEQAEMLGRGVLADVLGGAP
ncbi:hypothetical protein [Luteimonas sp. MC1572]|uniref:hypothetical protein n=1 Tax=Luteimonas sp. MC1572 TaxID=2799325 RepID=UPI0018F065CC|nr:hypothetical protein [Luteimonas sp. MC1572]MBJ6982000.1 hypothetical protein [Luteimonas sp. MC1572]QQO03299.1 hypothetical protein JGR64_00495 [Luteimonas sp. MC1572]